MRFPLDFWTSLLMSVVDYSPNGLKSNTGKSVGQCPPEPSQCKFSYMKHTPGFHAYDDLTSTLHNCYTPNFWHLCHETEVCRPQTKLTWTRQQGYRKRKRCPVWEQCKPNQGLQSPVNIDDRFATYVDFRLRFTNSHFINGHFINDGKAPKFTTEKMGYAPSKAPTLKGVPGRELADYIFYQLHFHIGSKAREHIGSEHSINRHFHDGEIHMVHWKYDSETKSLAEAAGVPNGLAVIGVFFDIDETSPGNGVVDHIIQTSIKNIKNLYQSLRGKINPEHILPKNQCIYSYSGSKTTPPCIETVRFLLYSTPIKISRKSYNILAGLQSTDGPGGRSLLSDFGNRRPIQERPVNDLIRNCHFRRYPHSQH